MEIILVLLPLYAIGYMIMFFKDRGDMFYIKHKKMVTGIPQTTYLKKEILELEDELELAEQQGLPKHMIDEIKKELDGKKTRLQSL